MKKLKTTFKLGVVLASTLFATTGQAHECRALGQANAWDPGGAPVADAYWLCLGFSKEDGVTNPGEGLPNNLDFFPYFVPGVNSDNYSSLDAIGGDRVDITATLVHMNDTFTVIPDLEADPFFFFKVPGIGYESPLAKSVKTIKKVVQVEAEGDWAYRAKKDFILPFQGMYAWLISGTVQKVGYPPVRFETKWPCLQPRLPYGPFDPADTEGTLVAAPEGWFDCARPAADDATTAATAGRTRSPSAPSIMARKRSR